MFNFLKNNNQSMKLVDLVPKKSRGELLFDRINADLGSASDEIRMHSKEMHMAYAYARATSASALYIQGYFSYDDYDYVESMFKAISMETEPSVAFQEKAFRESIDFMKTYNSICTANFVKWIDAIAKNFKIPPGHLSDGMFIRLVIDFGHKLQSNEISKFDLDR